MDIECSICCSIQDSIENLTKICQHIEFACQGKSKKSDFGLYKSYVERICGDLERMQDWHNYYHATGKSLKDSMPTVNYDEKPPFKRFRPG